MRIPNDMSKEGLEALASGLRSYPHGSAISVKREVLEMLVNTLILEKESLEAAAREISNMNKVRRSEAVGTHVAMLQEQNILFKNYLRMHEEVEFLKVAQQTDAQKKPKPEQAMKRRLTVIRTKQKELKKMMKEHIQWILMKDTKLETIGKEGFDHRTNQVATINPGSEYSREKAHQLTEKIKGKFKEVHQLDMKNPGTIKRLGANSEGEITVID